MTSQLNYKYDHSSADQNDTQLRHSMPSANVNLSANQNARRSVPDGRTK